MVALADGALALVVAAAALVPAIGLARGWNAEGRTADTRFAWLTGTAAALAALALGLLAPVWLVPVATGGVAAALLPFGKAAADRRVEWLARSEEHTSELQSLMRISYAVFCLKKKKQQ